MILAVYNRFFAELDSNVEVMTHDGHSAVVDLFAWLEEPAAYEPLLVDDVLASPSEYSDVAELTDDMEMCEVAVSVANEYESSYGKTRLMDTRVSLRPPISRLVAGQMYRGVIPGAPGRRG